MAACGVDVKVKDEILDGIAENIMHGDDDVHGDDDAKLEDGVKEAEKNETDVKKFRKRVKAPLTVEQINERRAALFQKYLEGGEEGAMVYLKQLGKSVEYSSLTTDLSGNYCVSLDFDGQTFQGSGANTKSAKNCASITAMRALFLASDLPYCVEHADALRGLASKSSTAEPMLPGSSTVPAMTLSNTAQVSVSKSNTRSKKSAKKKTEASGNESGLAVVTEPTEADERADVQKLSLSPNQNPSFILNALATFTYIEVQQKISLLQNEVEFGEQSVMNIDPTKEASETGTGGSVVDSLTKDSTIKMSTEMPTVATNAAVLTSDDELQSTNKEKPSKSSSRSHVMAVRVNNEIFEGTADTKRKAKIAACAEALLKLYNLHCDVAPDGTRYFAGDEEEWKCFMEKKQKKAVSIRPSVIVATNNLTPRIPVKTTVPGNAINPSLPHVPVKDHPVTMLFEVCQPNFQIVRISDTPSIYSASLNIEGCQFEGRGETKADAKRVAAAAALASIEAIAPVVDRFRARKAKSLGLLTGPPGVPTTGVKLAKSPKGPQHRNAVALSTQDYAYGYRRVAPPASYERAMSGQAQASRREGLAALFKKKKGMKVPTQPPIKEEPCGSARYNPSPHERGMDFISFDNGGARVSRSGDTFVGGGHNYNGRMAAAGNRCMGSATAGGMGSPMTQHTYLNPGMDVGRTCSATSLMPSANYAPTQDRAGGTFTAGPYGANRMVVGNASANDGSFFNQTANMAGGVNKFRGGFAYQY